MKPLRDLLDPPLHAPIAPLLPTAILATAARSTLDPEVGPTFDRAHFGLSPDGTRALQVRQLHLLELVWEALEASSVTLPGIVKRSTGAYVADPVDPDPLRDVLGLDGPVRRYSPDTAGAMRALSAATRAVTSAAVDLAVVVGRWGDQGMGVLIVAKGDVAPAAARVGRILGTMEASTAETALARLRERTGVEAGRQANAHDLGAVLQACSSRDVVEIHAADSHGHVVIQVLADRPNPSEGPPPRLLRLSARTRPALRELVGQVMLRIQSPTDLRSMAVDASRRAQLERRIAVPTHDLDAVADRLGAWLAGDRDAVAADRVTGKGTGMVFPPAGAQAANVAGVLYDHEPAFRAAVMNCDRVLRRRLPRPLLSLMFPQPGREHPLTDPLVASPVTFVLGWSLAELLRAWGVAPTSVLGAGVGEVVAAVVAGAISLEDGLRLAVARGRLLRQVGDRGARIVIPGSEEQAREWLGDTPDVDVVAVPVPHKTVVGGTAEAVERLALRAADEGMAVERVAGHPGHTALIEPFLDEYREAAAAVRCAHPSIHWVSSATGGLVREAIGVEHWVATVRAPIRFATACEEAYFAGTRTFVELAARPVMAASGHRTLSHLPVRWISALRGPGHDDLHSLDEAMAALWTRGTDLPASEAPRGVGAPLPPTPFARRAIDLDADDEVEMPLVTGVTIIPDELANPDAEREGWVTEDFAPPIAPPSLLEDLANDGDEEPTELVHGAEISTFFGDEGGAPAPITEPAPPPLPSTALAREVWERLDQAPRPDVETATWIVLADQSGFGDYLLAVLGDAGHRGHRVLECPAYPRGDGTLFVPDPLAPNAWDAVIDHLGTLSGPVRIVHLWDLDERPHRESWLGLIRLAETFRRYGLMAPIYVVTRGLHGEEPNPSAGLLWGVGRRLQVEAPEQWGGVIDLDEEEDADLLLAHLLERGAPNEVVFRGDQRMHRVWEAVEPDATPLEKKPWLVVGDADEVSLALAEDLVGRGAERVLVLSEAQPTPELTMKLLDLQKRKVRCTIIRGGPATDGPWRERLEREGELGGVVARIGGSTHKVMGRAEDVGRKQVTTLDGLDALFARSPRAIAWFPADAFDDGGDAPWAAVLGPVVAQGQRAGLAVVCLPHTVEGAARVVPAAHPGEVVVGVS